MIKSVKLKILLVVFIFLVFLFSGFFYLAMVEFEKETKLHETIAVAQSKRTFDSYIEEETRMLKMGLLGTIENDGIKNLFLEKDRQKLYDFTEPLFENKKNELGLTHWLFHEPDRNVFLRVHSPDIFGMSTKERITLTRAEQSKSWGIGMELGSVGFALRVVHPFYDGDNLIGYMEYGEDITTLIQRMKNQTGNDFLMIAPKTNIDAEQWKNFQESAGLRNNFDDLQNFVILGSTDERLVALQKDCLSDQALGNLPATGTLLNKFELDNKNYTCGGFAMIDTNGDKIGAVIVTRDITTEVADANRVKNLILLGSILSSLFFYSTIAVILNRIIVVPLRSLTNAAYEIEKGNLTRMISVKTGDEIGRLASAFDKMREKLKNSNELLEENVNLKTIKLSEALKDIKEKNMNLEDSKRAMLNVLEDFEESKNLIEKEKFKYAAERDRGEGILRYLHAIDEGVIATDIQGKLTFINLTAVKMVSRIEGNSLIGKKYSEEFPFYWGRGDDKKVIDPAGEALKKNGAYVLPPDCYLVTGSSKIPVAGSFAPITKDNKTLGVVSVFQDITERYKIEKEKDDFISIAAHQLRTPLAGIRWMIESLIDGDSGELPEEAKETLGQIDENNQRLSILVNDLLDVSRINMGKSKEEIIPVNICKMLKEAVETLKGLASERKVMIAFGKICALDLYVKFGPKHLFQALENLISNAIKYTPAGGSVTVSADSKGNKVIVSVSDTGIGIPKNEQGNIFKKFFRANNAALKETEGSGLGLNVVKSFIDEAGGKIWFESEEGKGTTFFIELAVADPETKAVNPHTESR
jgi:signal transduction histidine kinase